MKVITSRREQQAENTKAKALNYRQRQDLRDMLATPGGRRILYGILRACHTWDDIPVGSAETHAQLGARRVGLHLLGLIEGLEERDGTMGRTLHTMRKEWLADPVIPVEGVSDEPGGVEADTGDLDD